MRLRTTLRFALGHALVLAVLLGAGAPLAPGAGLPGVVAASLVAAAVTGWWAAGRRVDLMLQLADAVRDVAPESLDERVDVAEREPLVEVVQEELNRALDRLELGFQAQERFLANVCHELKTPIAVVLSELQALPPADESDEHAEFVATVRLELSRLGRVVDSFLALGRAEEAGENVRVEAVSMNDVALEAIASTETYAQNHDVRLVPLLAEDDVETCGERELLQTLLENLLRNAVRFSPHAAAVHLETARRGDSLEFTVRDAGPGLPPELLGTIFERYSQAGSERNSGRGTGIGLAIAHSIVALHRGSIDAENPPAGGCVMRVRVPISDEEDWRGSVT